MPEQPYLTQHTVESRDGPHGEVKRVRETRDQFGNVVQREIIEWTYYPEGPVNTITTMLRDGEGYLITQPCVVKHYADGRQPILRVLSRRETLLLPKGRIGRYRTIVGEVARDLLLGIVRLWALIVIVVLCVAFITFILWAEINQSLFFVPSERSSDFDVSFWAGLYSGLVYSTLVGLVLGIVIFLWQRNIELRSVRRDHGRELAVFRDQLHLALTRPAGILIGKTAAETVHAGVAEVMHLELITKLDLWFDDMPRARAFLEHVKGLRDTYYYFLRVARYLDTALVNRIQLEIALGTVKSVHIEHVHRFFIAKILGADDEMASQGIGCPSMMTAELGSVFNAISADPNLQRYAVRFLNVRTRHLKTVEHLWHDLD